jgi:hopanoid biosynthesis associated protein HpnK
LRRLIVTADDFGLSLPVNEAIARAHRDGILTAASLMVGAPATADAVMRAKALPTLAVGLHVVLVNGRPVLPPEDVPDLVDDDGLFSTHLARAGVQFFFNPAARRQLAAEIRAQFEAFRATGLPLDHVNAQNHMHVHPTVLSLILHVGRAYGMRAVRVPREPFLRSWRSARNNFPQRLGNAVLLGPWLGLMRTRLRRARLACNDALFGLNDTGRMTRERVLQLLPHLPHGVTEMYFHPATERWSGAAEQMAEYAFEDEFAALISPDIVRAMRASGIESISFSELTGADAP